MIFYHFTFVALNVCYFRGLIAINEIIHRIYFLTCMNKVRVHVTTKNIQRNSRKALFISLCTMGYITGLLMVQYDRSLVKLTVETRTDF